MTKKLKAFGLWLGQHAKSFAGLAGSAGTLAVTLFPSDHRVQEIGGALGVFSTYLLVHIVPNSPATQESAAIQLEASVGQVVPSLVNVMHTHEPELLAALRVLGNALGTLAAQGAVSAPEPSQDAAPATTEPAAPDSEPSPDPVTAPNEDVPRMQPSPEPEVAPDPVIRPEVAPSEPADEPALLG